MVELVDVVRELRSDKRLGFRAAEDQDPVQGAQRRLAVAGQLGNECGPRTDETGIDEVEYRPEIAETVLDRCPGESDAAARRQAAELLRSIARRVLHSLRLVEIEAQHLRPTPDHDQPHRRAQRVPQLPTRRGRHAQLIETVTSFQNHVGDKGDEIEQGEDHR